MKHKFAVKAIVAALALAASAAGWGQQTYVDCNPSSGPVPKVDICIGAVPTIRTALTGDVTYSGLIEQYPDFSGLTVGVHYDPSGVLVNDIKNALDTGADSPYDLFLAADTTGPASLRSSYPEKIAIPKNYAEGVIMLWSNGDQYSINANLPPATFAANYTTTGICNPNMGPYGRVAQTVLQEIYGIDPDPATNPKVKPYPMIDDVDTAIRAGGGMTNGAQSGWVPTALHCKGGQVFFDDINVTYRVFTPAQGEYPPAYQAGTAIQSTRGKQTLAQGFLDWTTTDGQPILANYCLPLNTK
jgi:ABC-type molybdate transport system substrate-binding protein